MKYIGYFEKRKNGELIDDYKEWVEADSEMEATQMFVDDMPYDTELVMVVQE